MFVCSRWEGGGTIITPSHGRHLLDAHVCTIRSFFSPFLVQDPRGAPLDRWTMCGKEEEPLVLQQFLRFGETRYEHIYPKPVLA